jgi:hypothetical protein
MDCADLRGLLARGEPLSGSEAEAHLQRCAACAELAADGGRLGAWLGSATAGAGVPAAADLELLLGVVERRIEREHGPIARLRSLPSPARVGLAIAGAAAVALGVLLFLRRPDLGVYPTLRLLSALGAYALLAAAAVRIALRPLQLRALPIGFRVGVVAAGVIVPFVVAAAPAAHLAHPASISGPALPCFLLGCALALPALVLLWALDRGGHESWTGALASAAAAGLVGVLGIDLHCPVTDPAHLLAGHATIAVAFLLGYALLSVVRARGA